MRNFGVTMHHGHTPFSGGKDSKLYKENLYLQAENSRLNALLIHANLPWHVKLKLWIKKELRR